MELVVVVLVVIVVLAVTLVLVRRNGLGGSGVSRDARRSKDRGEAMEARYQAEHQDGGPGSQ